VLRRFDLQVSVTLRQNSYLAFTLAASGGIVDPLIYRNTGRVWSNFDHGVKLTDRGPVPAIDLRNDPNVTEASLIVLPGTPGGIVNARRRARFVRHFRLGPEGAPRGILAVTQTTRTNTESSGIAGWDYRVALRSSEETSFGSGPDTHLVYDILPDDPFGIPSQSAPKTPGGRPQT
jgi:hypothetical protein